MLGHTKELYKIYKIPKQPREIRGFVHLSFRFQLYGLCILETLGNKVRQKETITIKVCLEWSKNRPIMTNSTKIDGLEQIQSDQTRPKSGVILTEIDQKLGNLINYDKSDKVKKS